VPIAFMSGLIGRFFFQFGLTVAVAVMVSLFVSFTLDPMLSAVWHDPAGSRFARAPWLGRIVGAFERMVEGAHRLYGNSGFTPCGAFLDYPDSEWSAFFEKWLRQPATA